MNKKEEYIIFGTIVVILMATIIYYCLPKKVEKSPYNDNYEIIYYDEGYLVYDITATNVINVEVSEQIVCVKAPCNPIHLTSYKVPYEKKYRDLFEELFSDTDSNKISITRKDIGYADYVVLSEILSKYSARKGEVNYRSRRIDDSMYSTRGYIVENTDNETRVVISMGERNTGGYSIDVYDVDVNNYNVEIIVKETSPKPNDRVTMAFTYPSVEITLPFVANNVTVYNTDKYKYNLIKK